MSQSQIYPQANELKQSLPTAGKLFFNLLKRLKVGHLHLITPEGNQYSFGDLHQPVSAALTINDWRACAKILRAGDIGFAECIEENWVESPNLTSLLRLALQNQAALNKMVNGGKLSTFWYRLRHLLRPNTREGSKKNIHAHYDIGNDFYRQWLDETLTYSSALFDGDFGITLAEAQTRKYQRIIDVLELKAGDHVLEIGCGWGGFAEHAVQQGIKVTGITISVAQLTLAQQRLSHYTDLAELKLCDYRDLQGHYDAVVSIEMFEAVGERFWKDYFSTVEARLKPGGRALIQSITIAESDFERYRSNTDFIQQYIFPGGMLPSPERFCNHAQRSGLEVIQHYPFGKDYAETLRRWHKTWEQQYAEIVKFGFDERFMRIWRLYFAYCEAGFDEGKTDVMHFLLRKVD